MANRYLVGTGARNVSNTAIWSDTSGGSGGFSSPTSADAVIFDANSGTGVLTMDVATSWGSLDSSALTASVTLTGAVYTLSLYGNLTEHVTYSLYNFTGTSYFYIKDNCTITTNGRATHAWNRLYIDGVGITVTNADDCNLGATQINLVNGTWDHGNFNITSTSGFQPNTGTKTLTLGSGTFTVTQFIPTTITINAGTSTIICTAGNIRGAATFYNVELRGVFNSSINDVNSFNNLTIVGANSISAILSVISNQTVSGVLTITGYNDSTARALVASNTIGTPRTITCNGTTNITNADFRDITLAGTANRNFSAQVDIGDCGGNSGITFPVGVPQYFKKFASTANYGDAANWFSDVALTVAGRVPLPQDDATFLAGSFNQTCNVSVNVPRICRSLDMSAVANAVTWTLANAIEVYGSYVLGNNITPSGSYVLSLYGIGTYDLNLYSKTIYAISLRRGTYTLLNNFTLSSYFEQQASNTFYLGSFILNSLMTAAGNAYAFTGTLYSETSTIILAPASGSSNITLALGGKTYNKIQLSGSHTGNFDFTSSNTIAELIVDDTRKYRFTASTTQNIATLTLGTGITESSITAATHTINYTGSPVVHAPNATVSYSIVSVANKLFAGAGGTDGGNNTNWNFSTPELVLPVFTEVEVLESNLLNQPIVSAAFTESEEMDVALVGGGVIVPIFDEDETLESTPLVNVFVLPEFTEEEIMFAIVITDIIASLKKSFVGQMKRNSFVGQMKRNSFVGQMKRNAVNGTIR